MELTVANMTQANVIDGTPAEVLDLSGDCRDNPRQSVTWRKSPWTTMPRSAVGCDTGTRQLAHACCICRPDVVHDAGVQASPAALRV